MYKAGCWRVIRLAGFCCEELKRTWDFSQISPGKQVPRRQLGVSRSWDHRCAKRHIAVVGGDVGRAASSPQKLSSLRQDTGPSHSYQQICCQVTTRLLVWVPRLLSRANNWMVNSASWWSWLSYLAANVRHERKLANFQGIIASEECWEKEQCKVNLASDFKKV